ncbi:MAG: 3-oxoacyl-[acyl-carrier-protein] synthase [Myxococcaceae bacterium]|nr:3-oxoacyl-[acyl-carrier-protein] synthase [Myxococcaceae bacterium]
MLNAYISGTGFYAPPRVVTNDDLRTVYGIDTTDEWVEQRTGIKERRFADAGVSCSDLAVQASEQAIERAGLQKSDIGMIIFCTLSPDRFFPGTGVALQKKLGLCNAGRFIPCMDIRNQCSGFLYGLSTATALVQTGAHKHILLVGAEVHSSALDLTTRGRTVAVLFGDAAGAVVVSATEEDRGVRGTYLGADGRYADALELRVWDIAQKPYIALNEEGVAQVKPSELYPRMDGPLVFKNAVARMLAVMMETFQKHQLTVADVDLFCFHQANLRINQHIQEQIGAPADKFVNNIQRYGNTTAATLPSLLFEAEQSGRLKRGMKVVMVAFGAGFTWGCSVIDW